MERNVANIYEARRQLTAVKPNIDADVSPAPALSVTDSFYSASATIPVYSRPGQHLIIGDT